MLNKFLDFLNNLDWVESCHVRKESIDRIIFSSRDLVMNLMKLRAMHQHKDVRFWVNDTDMILSKLEQSCHSYDSSIGMILDESSFHYHLVENKKYDIEALRAMVHLQYSEDTTKDSLIATNDIIEEVLETIVVDISNSRHRSCQDYINLMFELEGK